MVKYIRNIDIAKGLELKKPTPSENKIKQWLENLFRR